jgi:CHAT domain-containing protein
LPVTASEIARKVQALRSTISTWENGVPTTYAFDVALGRELFVDLFAPVSSRLVQSSHLIFEPDGAMLQLPVNLLIAEQSGVDAYLTRLSQSGADEFDFRGIAWLGRTTAVSTSISARSFRDARAAPASAATRQYLGFGNNAPAFAQVVKSPVRGRSTFDSMDCNWPLSQWNRPIADTELLAAAKLVGSDNSQVITGKAFTDSAIKSQSDLGNYRILHFATHGFVTAPQIGCPARPSLLTSIGAADSDGLLSFGEIFDLKIDADVVILSACDTAGQASAFATQEAGLRTGGGTALDGLVRAFIGSGGRSVIASHWPAPDEFNATGRLISGLFAARNISVAEAMRQTQTALMDDADTSHPFYWSGFAIVGDGARQFLGGS